MKNDKAYWTKWMARLLKEAKKTTGLENVPAFDDFEKNMNELEKAQGMVKNDPAVRDALIKMYKSQMNLTDEEARKAADEFSSGKHIMEYLKENKL